MEGGDFQSGEDGQESRAIRALADLFTCPATTFPLSVGLFYDTINIAKSTNLPSPSLEELQGKMGNSSTSTSLYSNIQGQLKTPP